MFECGGGEGVYVYYRGLAMTSFGEDSTHTHTREKRSWAKSGRMGNTVTAPGAVDQSCMVG